MSGANETKRPARLPHRLVASPTLNPRLPLEAVAETAAAAGFTHFEVMTDWAASAVDVHSSPSKCLTVLSRYGLAVTSMHLPRISAGDRNSLANAVAGVKMAAALGAEVVIYKADTAKTYADHATQILGLATSSGLKVVVTNHKGSAISSLEDYLTVLGRVGDDRLGALLEIGHFAAVGVDWRAAADALSGRIQLVHIKDIRDGAPVTYGSGEIDFPAVARWLQCHGYRGAVVVEIEKVADEDVSRELAQAVKVISSAGNWS